MIRPPGPSTELVKIREFVPVTLAVCPEGIVMVGEKVRFVAAILVGQFVIEPVSKERLEVLDTEPTKDTLPPSKVTGSTVSTVLPNVMEPPINKSAVGILTAGVKFKIPVVSMLLGQVVIEPDSKEKFASSTPLPIPGLLGKEILPPCKVRLPGPLIELKNAIELVPVNVAVWPEAIVIAGVKESVAAVILLGHMLMDPDAREKFERAVLSPTSPEKVTLPLRIRLPGPLMVLPNVIELPVTLEVLVKLTLGMIEIFVAEISPEKTTADAELI